MNEIAIRVKNLSKQYRLGEKKAGYHTFREALLESLTMPVRWLRGDQRTFESFMALNDISFEVEQGEAIGIIGRNGAGKSTLLKVLSRITKPTEGRVDLYGRIASLLEVGTGFHSELSGRDNIYLNGAILGMSSREIGKKFDEIVDFSGVEKFLDTTVKHYSSGMYMRLAFAVAAHLEPEILIVDEVLAVGDAEFQKKCLGKMEDVAKEGRTVLFVSHNMAAIRRLCSRVILMNHGTVLADGPTESVIGEYLANNLASPASVIEFAPPKTPSTGYATRMTFMDFNGQPRSEFQIGEKWKAVLEFEMIERGQQVIAGIGIVSDGIGLITYWSMPRDLDRGKYVVEFEVNLPVSACQLQFAVGLTEREQTFYHLQDIGHVSISDLVVDSSFYRTHGAGILFGKQSAEIKPV